MPFIAALSDSVLEIQMFYIYLSVSSNPDKGKAADFIVSVSADGCFGIPDQTARVDQADPSSLE